MDRHEIAAQVLSAPWSFAGTPGAPSFAARFCRDVNRGYAELIESTPGGSGPSSPYRWTARTPCSPRSPTAWTSWAWTGSC